MPLQREETAAKEAIDLVKILLSRGDAKSKLSLLEIHK